MFRKINLAEPVAAGFSFVAMAAREDPCLIMVDMNLPDMTGEDVVARLRGDRSSVSAIPIMAVTASTDSNLRKRVIAAGCDSYVQKPYTMQELIMAVEKVFDVSPAISVN